MAGGNEDIVRGNSNQQPLNTLGHTTASHVGQSLARLGGPDQILPGGSRRTVETGQDVSRQTGAPMGPPNPNLESHAMGNLEGEPKTPEVKKYLASLVKNQPNVKIPGQGAMSNRPGESFNEFRVRALSAVRGLMQRLASNPNQRILVPISTQVIRLVEAWAALGCPDDLAVSPDEFLKERNAKPGEIDRFFPSSPDANWKMTPFKPEGAKEFPPGIYFMRHGETDSVQEAKANAHQKASAQLVAHVRAGRYKEARDTAKHAIGNGLMSEDDAGQMVDLALPNANDAERLPPDQLLSAVSAAGPQKQAELMPVLQRKLGTMQGMSPEGQQAIRTHLGRIRPQAAVPPARA
jgi:broad specificity phosphatase PhoE